MKLPWSKTKESASGEKLPAKKPPEKKLTYSLEDNIGLIKELFKDVDPVRYRNFKAGPDGGGLALCFIFYDGLVNSEIIDNFILRPLMTLPVDFEGDPLGHLMSRVVQVNSVKKTGSLDEIVQGLSYGDSLLLAEGCSELLLMDTKQFSTRGISEPEGEKILSGPREGFGEAILQNLSLVRRKLRTNDLKMKFQSQGRRSNTSLCVVYMESLVRPGILDELFRRLSAIDIDALLDTNYVIELIQDAKWSVFRTVGYTERPDVIAGKLLEGRVAVFVDGSPVVLTVPYLFIENFQSNEDYYFNYYYTSFSRILRIVSFFIAISAPALYVAVVAYHHEMLPTPLMINIAVESHNVPLPAALEAFILLILFDVLRETGLRMPLGVGQALSVVGGLVLGSAAVEADLVSATMIIVTAISGITNLLVPRMSSAVVLLRFILLLLASCFGFFGLTMGLSVLLIHMLQLESFGVLQLTPDRELRFQRLKDTAIRAPWWLMRTRPGAITEDRVRLRAGKEEKR
jgi:spore germination protein KA